MPRNFTPILYPKTPEETRKAAGYGRLQEICALFLAERNSRFARVFPRDLEPCEFLLERGGDTGIFLVVHRHARLHRLFRSSVRLLRGLDVDLFRSFRRIRKERERVLVELDEPAGAPAEPPAPLMPDVVPELLDAALEAQSAESHRGFVSAGPYPSKSSTSAQADETNIAAAANNPRFIQAFIRLVYQKRRSRDIANRRICDPIKPQICTG